jgi:hypothetical protein
MERRSGLASQAFFRAALQLRRRMNRAQLRLELLLALALRSEPKEGPAITLSGQ